jgi:hypothetical protein
MAARKSSPKPSPSTNVRDAVTGRYAPKEEAARRPRETVTEPRGSTKKAGPAKKK